MHKIILIIFSIVIGFNTNAQTIITDVTIVDVQKHALVPNQTVVIENGIISAIVPSKKFKMPKEAKAINGKGKFLMPGMIDAHIHFFQSGGLYTRPDVIDLRSYRPYQAEIDYSFDQFDAMLRRYLKNGITGVIDVGASFNLLKKRKEFANKPEAPTVQMAGPLLTTYEPQVYQGLQNNAPFILVKSVDDAIKGVQQQLPHQPDLIKVWYIVGHDGLSVEASARKSLPVIKAIIDEAHRHQLKVAVHATQRITAQLAVENGADMLVHFIDDEVLTDEFIGLMKKNKTIISPTLTVHAGYNKVLGQQFTPSSHLIAQSDPYQLGTLMDLRHLSDTVLTANYVKMVQAGNHRFLREDSVSRVNIKKLSDAGVCIATGTDAGNIGTLHASSYLDELKAMQESGMSNWSILTASTLHGAKAMSKESEFGSVSTGKKANMILLNANPVDAIENVTQIEYVINQGTLFKPEALLKVHPEDLVQQQLNAYNCRDIDAFLEPYHDEVEVYEFPDKLLYKGKQTMRLQYADMFSNVTNLHCELLGRLQQGNIVIDRERVRVFENTFNAIAMYHIEDGKIKKVYFVQ
jgi:imidazolonepropionase-like amidohydrolase